jgi:hypothetical protein
LVISPAPGAFRIRGSRQLASAVTDEISQIINSPWTTSVNMIRKGRVRWIAKEDPVGQARFVGNCSESLPEKRAELQAKPKAIFFPLVFRNTTRAHTRI